MDPARNGRHPGDRLRRFGRIERTTRWGLPEVILLRIGVVEDFLGGAVAENLARPDHVTAVGDRQRFPLAVIGDQNGNARNSQAHDELLDGVDRHRVDPGKGFI